MVGKDPHRIEGKKGADEWHRRSSVADATAAANLHEQRTPTAEIAAPNRFPAEEEFGGSRPNVESRVKDAISKREEREEE